VLKSCAYGDPIVVSDIDPAAATGAANGRLVSTTRKPIAIGKRRVPLRMPSPPVPD
jgi:hypothetical protein